MMPTEIILELTKAKKVIGNVLDNTNRDDKNLSIKDYDRLCEVEVELRRIMANIRDKESNND